MDLQSRRAIAQRLLQETVYESRGRGASTPVIAGSADLGGCGLGKGPNLELGWGTRGEQLAADLWPAGLEDDAAERMRAVLKGWVKRQDGLDRKRNHFLKDFRNAHGFDPARYSAELIAQFESGLDTINGQNRDELAQSAIELLDAAGSRNPAP